MNIVNFMDPIIWNPETREFGKQHAATEAGHSAEPSTSPSAATDSHAEPITAPPGA